MAQAFLMGQNGSSGNINIQEGTLELTMNSQYVTTYIDHGDGDEELETYNVTQTGMLIYTKNIKYICLKFDMYDYITIDSSERKLKTNGVYDHEILIDSNFVSKQLYTVGLWQGKTMFGDDTYSMISSPIEKQLGYLTPLVQLSIQGIGTNSVSVTFYVTNQRGDIYNIPNGKVKNVSYKILG